jgi:preprotein translocase subunit YajC
VTSETLGTLFPLLLIVLAFWLLVIRPARKRQSEMTRIQNSVQIGSEVMLGSGIFGTVTSIGDETLTLAVAPGTEIKVARQAVVRVVDGTTAGGGAAGEPTDRPEQP